MLSLIHSLLDFANFILVKLSAYIQRQLQSVLNAAAGLVSGFDATTTSLMVMAFQALNGLSAPYLVQLVCVADLPGRYRLHSSSSQIPAYPLATVGQRSFAVAASILWNSLPPGIQSSASLADFCHKLVILVPPVIVRHFAVIIHISTSLSWTSMTHVILAMSKILILLDLI